MRKNKLSEFQKLKNGILNCSLCRDLFGFKPKPIFWGNLNAKIVHISQAPSRRVHIKRKVWSDKSGEKLRHEWYRISDSQFFNPNNFYITALAHCYPGKNKSNDKPPPIICAKKWLLKEIDILDPKLIIIIGSLAAKFFFPNQNFVDLVFNEQTLKGKPCIVLPHPSSQNIKWFKENPEFEKDCLPKIRKYIHSLLKSFK